MPTSDKDIESQVEGSMSRGRSVSSHLPLRILVVDDDEVTRRLVSRLLQRQGYEVEAAREGQEALRLLTEHHYDLALMDVEMPRLGGLEVASRIRSLPGTASGLPIVGLTAHESPEEPAVCLAAGMDGVIRKPVRAAELFRAVERWLKFPTGPAGEPVVELTDESRPAADLQGAAARCGGDLEFVAQLLTEFVQDAPDRLGNLKALAGRQDWPGLMRAAHQLKGAAGNLSAIGLAELARRLEEFAKGGEQEATLEILMEIEQEFGRLANYMSAGEERGKP